MNKTLILATPCVALLAACGGSSTGGVGYSDTLGKPSVAFSNGVELSPTEQAVAQVNTDWSAARGERTTTLEDPSFVSVKKGTGDTILVMNIEGQEVRFGPQHILNLDDNGNYNSLSIEDENGIWARIDGDNQALSDLLNGTGEQDSAQVHYFFYDSEDESNSPFGYAIVGTATNPSVLGDFTTTSYDGLMKGEAVSLDEFDSRARHRFELRGNTTLTANFEDKAISGNISNITYKEVNEGEPDVNGELGGNIVLSEAPINGNSFSGAAAFDTELMNSVDAESASISYSGNFYGDAANEASGTIQGTVIGNDGSQDNLLGGFRTSQ